MTYLDRQSGRAATLAVAGMFALLTLAACGGGGGGGGGPVATGSGPEGSPTAQQVRAGDRLTTDGDIVRRGTSTPGTLNGVEGTFTCAASGCALRTSSVSGSGVHTVTEVDGVTFTPASAVRTGETDGRPPTGTTTDMAEIAALSVPNSGGSSVTQSSNARNGRTSDSVSTTVEHNGSEYSYRLRNGSRWSISDDDTVENRVSGTLLGQSFNGVELRKNLAGGTLWAEIYTTREAPTPATGAGQPVRLEDQPVGSRVEGMTQAEWNARMGDGSLDGVAGTFSCDRAGGGSCPSFGGTHFDPTGTDWIFTPAGTTSSPDTDYLNLGLWVYVPNGVTDLLGWEYGVFADGSDPFDSGSMRGVTGSASYRGAATGVFVEQGEPEEIYWLAETRLTADFGDTGQLGTISGSVRNFIAEGEPVTGGLSVSLNAAPIGGSNNGFFTGSVGYTYRGATVRDGGRWGGRFFGNGEADGKPGLVAGTFGVTNGTGDSLLGAFATEKQ